MRGKGGRAAAVADHRPRVAQERRERTRTRIIESALSVFAEKGPDAPLIDDFIRAAGIARGTFYNYYRSTEELLEATSHLLEDDLIRSIEAELDAVDDPLERLATGILLWLRRAESDPVWCRFVVRVRRRAPGVERELGRDIREAMKTGRIAVDDAQVARDVVVGTILEAMGRMAVERVPRDYTTGVARAILDGIGADRRRVKSLLARPAPALKRRARSMAR